MLVQDICIYACYGFKHDRIFGIPLPGRERFHPSAFFVRGSLIVCDTVHIFSHSQATWPWVFNLIIRCSRITDPMIRVTQCKRVHNHQGQQSGPGVLTIGLAVFGVYLEIFDDPNSSYTGTGFRIALAAFQGIFIVFIVINMVQAVVPMMVTDDR